MYKRQVCVESRVGGAGQGLVAFATGALDKLDYAVKFFLHRPSFHAERALYKSQTLGKLLPQVRRPHACMRRYPLLSFRVMCTAACTPVQECIPSPAQALLLPRQEVNRYLGSSLTISVG